MKAPIKSLLFLITGVIIAGMGIYDVFMPPSEDAIQLGGDDNSYLYYILIGAVLIFAGIMGFIRAAQNQGKRNKY